MFFADIEEEGTWSLGLEAGVDARAVYDTLRAPEAKVPTEQGLIAILLSIRESLKQKRITRLWWIDTVDMVSDALTKGSVSHAAILGLLSTGFWRITKPSLAHSEAEQLWLTLRSLMFVRA